MTLNSIHEYAEAVRSRYFKAGKKDKSEILDEFIRVTGCHRKSAIRLLWSKRHADVKGRRGRPKRYGGEVSSALKIIWDAADHLCSKRLQPFLPELVSVLTRKGELKISAGVREQILSLSAATIDRLLQPSRKQEGRRPLSTTKPGSLLKGAIPIRTFADWEEDQPGFLEADLVAHCGDNVDGFFLNTLSTVDVATGWSECTAVWGKSQDRVGSGVHQIKERLPMPLLGLDSDNGSEFINQHLFEYCRRWHITFTDPGLIRKMITAMSNRRIGRW